jgi:hypothetical protein
MNDCTHVSVLSFNTLAIICDHIRVLYIMSCVDLRMM